jgi:hypothetical protein
MENKLIYNSVNCLSCGDTLISRHRHDYKVCSCENKTMVDGGLDYVRFGGKNLDLVQSYTIDDSDNFETLRFYIERGTHGINNDEPLKYVKLKDIDDEWLSNIINYEEELRPNNPYLKYYKKEQKYRLKNK